MNFRKLRNIIGFLRLKRTKKMKCTLRHQKVVVANRNMHAYDWLKLTAALLPAMYNNGKQVQHYTVLRQWYYTYDIAGANYYIKCIERSVKHQLNVNKASYEKTA